jgi:glycosyltransferase involved in cell wall biosynthesis
MNKECEVSVILCTFNEEKYICDSVNSILNQTFTQFELIIIDDNSTDNTVEIINSFNDNRIKLFIKPVDMGRGLASSRNYGVKLANSEYILFHDADDICTQDRIGKQYQLAMQSPNKKIVGCWLRLIQNNDEKIVKYPFDNITIRKKIQSHFGRNVIAGQVLLSPKWVFEKYPYRTCFKYMQDYDQLYRVIENTDVEFQNIEEPLYTYYIRSKGVKAKSDWPKYNIYVRYCRMRRQKGKTEPKNITAFEKDMKNNILKNASYMTGILLLKLKANLESI